MTDPRPRVDPEWLKEAEAFHDKLMREGIPPITAEDQARIDKAIADAKARYPDAKPMTMQERHALRKALRAKLYGE